MKGDIERPKQRKSLTNHCRKREGVCSVDRPQKSDIRSSGRLLLVYVVQPSVGLYCLLGRRRVRNIVWKP